MGWSVVQGSFCYLDVRVEKVGCEKVTQMILGARGRGYIMNVFYEVYTRMYTSLGLEK